MTGQLVSTFQKTPQLPLEEFSVHFFGGSRAPLEYSRVVRLLQDHGVDHAMVG